MPIGEALQYADRCRNDGQLMEAEAACRQILRAQPNLPEAEHLLGAKLAPGGPSPISSTMLGAITAIVSACSA